MHNPDQLPLLIAFMLFTFVVMAGMSFLFAKWMKRHKQMEDQWLADGRASHVHDHGHHH
jgi:predicted permease